MSDDETSESTTHPVGTTQPSLSNSSTHGTLNFSAVVKLFVARSCVSYKMPWQRQSTTNVAGSGFLIEGRLLISNVHVVQDATSILVRRHGSARKYPARILCMGWHCDLALLTVDDERFWKDYVGVTFGDVPQLRDAVICAGYPTGGDNVSVTCGVVSRVNLRSYSSLHSSFLTVQIDAAINRGNSGGPVFFENRVVGVARSHLKAAQNIGYIITTPVLNHFLNDYRKHGKFLGICSNPGFKMQSLENMALRRYHSMPEDVTGIYVHSIAHLSPFRGYLLEEDVLLKVDDVNIGDDGTIAFREDERIHFTYLFSRCPVGKTVKLTVLREGTEKSIGPVPMQITHKLVPRLRNCECIPSYYIVAGFVFQPLTDPLMSEIRSKTPTSITKQYTEGDPKSRDQQVVVLTQIMPSDLSIGYPSGFVLATVEKFNGKPVNNIKHLAKEVEKVLARFHETYLENQGISAATDFGPLQVESGSSQTPAEGNESESTSFSNEIQSTNIPSVNKERVNNIVNSRDGGASDSGDLFMHNGANTIDEPVRKQPELNRKENMMRFDLGNAVGSQYYIVLDPIEVIAQSKEILETYKIERKCCSAVAGSLTGDSSSS